MHRRRIAAAVAALLLLALPLSACAEVEEEEASGYEPSELSPVKGSGDLQRVTFTAEGAERVGLKTVPIRRSGGHEVVPYAALIYDSEGKTYVYTSRKRLSFVRAEVQVDRIDGDRVLLSDGPPARTKVVTVGADEVYGAELDIASG
jgi:ABC-type oligopeptide transport system substrate-binding subunit